MARLAEIIGPAPSELDINSHLRKLSKERDRVRDSLSALRQQPTTSRRKPAKRTKKVAVTKRVKALEQSGKSLTDIEALMQAALAKKENANANDSGSSD
jgi:hypothetical protein